MSVFALTSREGRSRSLSGLLLSVSLLTALAASAGAAPRSKRKNNPANYGFYHGKCISDQRTERLTENRR